MHLQHRLRQAQTPKPAERPIRLLQGVAEISAQHVKAGVRKIEHTHHAEDQRQYQN
jgi:hypothetical protein